MSIRDVTMSLPEPRKVEPDTDEWAKRKRNSVRLGLVFAAFVLAVFFLSIWKYRPL
jgi:hypothetical protein